MSLSAVAFAYRIAIADLVALRETVAQANGGSAELSGEIRAAGALSRATEYLARLQVEVLQSYRSGVATTRGRTSTRSWPSRPATARPWPRSPRWRRRNGRTGSTLP